MAASTTVKVATQTGAAKDDVFNAVVSEDSLRSKLAVLDNDPGAAKLYSLVPLGGLASATQVPVVTQGMTARGAVVTLNADGTISYDGSALAASLQSLAAGESAIDTFEYIVRMANGALSTAKVTVAIGGVNDAPTLLSVAAVAILDSAADDTPAAIAGALAGSDVDHGAVLSYGLVAGSSAYGTLTLGANGQYSFLANADQIDALNAGATATASFVVNVTDEKGAASAPVTLQFNFVGANDTASISGNGAGQVAEDGTAAAAGALAVSDRDSGQSVFAAPAILAGTYGDFSFDAATGAWSYALRNDAANVQALNEGKQVVDSITVQSLDATASQLISIAITGSNDLALISGQATGAVTEDGVLSASAQLTVTDVDSGEALFGATTSVSAEFGDFTFDAATGTWTYALRADAANVQALNAGQHVQDSMTVNSVDGTGHLVVNVDIAGSNDIAVISGKTTGTVVEDANLSASGQLTIADVDTGEAAFGATTVNASYGEFTFDAGSWTYLLHNDAAAVQALEGGQIVHDTLTVASRDGSAQQVITVSIHGHNEAPPTVPAPPVPPAPPGPPASPVDDYMITFGKNGGGIKMNGHDTGSTVITGFDANDVLHYAANLHATTETVDNDTIIHFTVKDEGFDVILIGVTHLNAGQVAGVNA